MTVNYLNMVQGGRENSAPNAHTPVGCVLADAEFDSDRNHTFVRSSFALSVIPAKRGKKDVDHSWRPRPNAPRFPKPEILSSCVD